MGAVVVGVLALMGFVIYSDQTVRTQFEGKRWALPARVYARPQELYPGLKLDPYQFTTVLEQLGYRINPANKNPAGTTQPVTVIDSDEAGSFQRQDQTFELTSRPFTFSDGPQPALHLRVDFSDNHVNALHDVKTGKDLTLARLDPLLIGSIYPGHNEDRILVKLNEIPPDLIKTLIAVEDRNFYGHHGIDPRGIARAALNDLWHHKNIQGGSTLTQQLVKNFYLSPERSIQRKFQEIIMALLLELHYNKNEILETYANEIYLGQDGSRAIHGFGLASEFYFGKSLSQLKLPEMALLVGLVKGPSYYDPRHHPLRAMARRNLVLSELNRQGIINPDQEATAKAASLSIVTRPPDSNTSYPAFMGLVYRQLRRDYREQDLRSEGLQILTTLDPIVQAVAEKSLTKRLDELEKQYGMKDKPLEGAVVITNTEGAEVLALVGGRDARFDGFNRALDAERQIGSLIKPAIYLTALEQPYSYTLETPLDDSPLVWHERGVKDWAPNNYDKQFHGRVPLRTSLAESYNVATVRLGLILGVDKIIAKAHLLGIEQMLPTYTSILLGSGSLPPIQVAQMYQTLASGGFRTPLRAIREILTANGAPLQQYPLAVEQVVDPAPIYLLTNAMQDVVQEGTAKNLSQYLSPDLHVAGKTGTTEDLRDSWFAGYTGDKLAVVWVGRDDNRPTGLTGASGAMTVWGDILAKLNPEPLNPPVPENIEQVWIDPQSHLLADQTCAGAIQLPFIRGSAPTDKAPCMTQSPGTAIKNWLKRLFER